MSCDTSPVQLTLFPLSDLAVRAFSYKRAVEEGLNPREYKVPDGPMVTTAMLAFKIWGKTPCLGCYFHDLTDGKRFVLYAYDDAHRRRYMPRDGKIDFSEPGIEGNVYRIVTNRTRSGKTAWQSADLVREA